MRTGLWLAILAVLATAAWAAGNRDVDDAWAGCTDTLPCLQSPQNLIDTAGPNLVVELSSTQRDKLDDDGGWGETYCYTYIERAERDHSYMVLRFNNFGSYNTYIARFRARSPSYYPVKLYAYDGEDWDYIYKNGGGDNPDPERGDVSDYMTGEQMLLLLQTYTGAGEEWFQVTLGDLEYE